MNSPVIQCLKGEANATDVEGKNIKSDATSLLHTQAVLLHSALSTTLVFSPSHNSPSKPLVLWSSNHVSGLWADSAQIEDLTLERMQ